VLVQQNVLEFQISVDARLLVDEGDGADELGKCLLYFFGRKWSILQEIVVQFIAYDKVSILGRI
jgi:hypothetical protein